MRPGVGARAHPEEIWTKADILEAVEHAIRRRTCGCKPDAYIVVKYFDRGVSDDKTQGRVRQEKEMHRMCRLRSIGDISAIYFSEEDESDGLEKY